MNGPLGQTLMVHRVEHGKKSRVSLKRLTIAFPSNLNGLIGETMRVSCSQAAYGPEAAGGYICLKAVDEAARPFIQIFFQARTGCLLR